MLISKKNMRLAQDILNLLGEVSYDPYDYLGRDDDSNDISKSDQPINIPKPPPLPSVTLDDLDKRINEMYTKGYTGGSGDKLQIPEAPKVPGTPNTSDTPKTPGDPSKPEIWDYIRKQYSKIGNMFIAITIFKLSQKYVPVDTGYLRDSGMIIPLDDENDTYRILYETPYAARQHEEIDYEHTEPGRAKFLEDAAYEILDYSSYSGDIPLFTFKLIFPGEGAVALDINTIDVDEFMSNRAKRELLLNMTWEGLDGLDS